MRIRCSPCWSAERIGVRVQEHQGDLRALMRRYRNRPMSLADGGAHARRDFRLDRRQGSKVIPLRMPD